MCQGPKENAEDFLIRALDLRQRIIFTSRVMEDGVSYSTDLVQAVFLRTLETGIHSETVRAKLRPLLKKQGTTDEELIKQVHVSDAVSEETERSSKLAVSSRKQMVKANCAVSSHCNEHEKDLSTQSEIPKRGKEEKPNMARNEGQSALSIAGA